MIGCLQKIKRNDWLLADTCPQAANHCALFWVWDWCVSYKTYLYLDTICRSLMNISFVALLANVCILVISSWVKLTLCGLVNSTMKGLPAKDKQMTIPIKLVKWAATCNFQQCGILTGVDSDEPVQPPFKRRNSKWCLVSSLTLIEYSSD